MGGSRRVGSHLCPRPISRRHVHSSERQCASGEKAPGLQTGLGRGGTLRHSSSQNFQILQGAGASVPSTDTDVRPSLAQGVVRSCQLPERKGEKAPDRGVGIRTPLDLSRMKERNRDICRHLRRLRAISCAAFGGRQLQKGPRQRLWPPHTPSPGTRAARASEPATADRPRLPLLPDSGGLRGRLPLLAGKGSRFLRVLPTETLGHGEQLHGRPLCWSRRSVPTAAITA